MSLDISPPSPMCQLLLKAYFSLPKQKATMTETEDKTKKGPVTQQKVQSVMEAASALTTLGEKESENGESTPSSPKTEPKETSAENSASETAATKEEKSKNSAESPKRFLPDHKKPDAALTFPEKLMKLMEFAQTQKEGDYCVSWLEDGKSFIIRNPDEFTRNIVPKFFKATKFSSFTRKLYRWGFRQVNRGIGPDDPIIFGNEHFQRDKSELMAKMRSVTAASSRKEEVPHEMFGMKRPFDGMDDSQQKRMLMDHFMQQKASMMGNPSLYGAMTTNGALSLSSAMRPSMGMGQAPNPNIGPMNGNRNSMPSFEMMHQQGQMQSQGNIQGQQMRGQQMQGQQMQGQQMQNYSMPSLGNNGSGNTPNAQSSQQQGGQFPNSSSTQEIVNAAIAALRYA